MQPMNFTLFFTFISLCFYSKAQVKTNFNNETVISTRGYFLKDYNTKIDFEVPAKSIAVLMEAEKRQAANTDITRPFRLADPIAVDLDIVKLANWTYDKAYAYGKFDIKLNGALSASINFDQFYLPLGTEMYIYNKDGNMITGPISEKENNVNKIWGSWVYKGEMLTVEIKTPLATKEQLLLHASNIAYGYKEVYIDRVGGFGLSAACHINVLCPLGTAWGSERNAVALVLNDVGSEWCSGAMVMNTCNSNRPFFLTANHCFTGQNVSAWRFTFQAWSATCTPSQNSNGVTYNGSTLRANWANSDFCLVELNNTPPTNSGIHFAGWTKSATPAQNATGIHHPNGDVMKIAVDNDPVVRSGGGYFANSTHWEVRWNQGITAVGSSGSPLFDNNRRIIGQLHGGTSYCYSPTAPDWYGSFDQSWTGGGTNATRLSNWLDPLNTGAVTTNTTNVSALQNYTLALAIAGANDLICSNGTSASYTLTGAPPGANIVWSISNTSIASLSATGNQATVTKNADGMLVLTATITNNHCINTNIATRGIILGTPQAVDIIGMSPSGYFSAGQYVTLSIAEQATRYNWSVAGGTIIGSNTGQSVDIKLDNCFIGQTANNNFSAMVSYQNGCGNSIGKIETTYAVCDGTSSPDFILKLTPNPAKEFLHVAIENEQPKVKSLPQNTLVQYELYDAGTNVIVKRWLHKNDQNERIFNLRGIKKGLYVLKVTKSVYQQSVKVVID